MLFRLNRNESEQNFSPLIKRSAADLNLAEKDLENWLSENSKLLFGSEEVLVISQSVSGFKMADILALDSEGNLVVVEIKRDWSSRETVGQLLEYAADNSKANYGYLNDLFNRYSKKHPNSSDPKINLLSEFRKLTEDNQTSEKDIPKGYRICIVAPGSDRGLDRIVKWLNNYGVPISFIPFTLYSDSKEIFLEIDQLTPTPVEQEDNTHGWQGSWFFNTNERWSKDAYKRMLIENVIAIGGYANGPENLEGSEAGQEVFAYVNERGIIAVGRITDGVVIPGNTIFGWDNEYHVKVEWETVVTEEKAITTRDVKEKFGKGLPVRCVFCGLYGKDKVEWIRNLLEERSK